VALLSEIFRSQRLALGVLGSQKMPNAADILEPMTEGQHDPFGVKAPLRHAYMSTVECLRHLHTVLRFPLQPGGGIGPNTVNAEFDGMPRTNQPPSMTHLEL